MTFICKNCGFIGDSVAVKKGSLGVELALWLFFLIPGLIYSLWRLSSRADGCSACRSSNVIPVTSPLGAQLVVTTGGQANIPSPRPPSSYAVRAGRSLGRLFSKK